MTVTPRLNRCLAALASLALVCGLAACTKTVDGTARYAGTQPSSDRPLVKIAQLPELLPTAGEVGQVMGGPGFVAALSYRSLESVPDDTVADPHCIGVVFGAVEPVYRGSGYQGVYGHRIVNPMSLTTGRVDEGAVAFGSAEEAQAFVSQQTAAWRDCAGRPLSLKVADQQVNWTASPPTVSTGVDVVARLQEGARGFGCARGLATASNVVADVVTCGDDGAAAADQAAEIVNMIVDKVPT